MGATTISLQVYLREWLYLPEFEWLLELTILMWRDFDGKQV